MRDEVFHRGDDPLLVLEFRIALEAAHGGATELGDQIGIFAVGFLDAAPARIARDIDHGRQGLVRAADACFVSGHREQLLDESGIEGRAQADGLGEAGAILGRVAVQAFLVKHHRDAEAAVFEEELLDGVGELRHAARGLAFGRRGRVAARVAGAADLADAVAFFESGLGFLQVEVAMLIHELLRLLLPDAHHLRGLFLKGHPRQQIADASGGGESWILVFGRAMRTWNWIS